MNGHYRLSVTGWDTEYGSVVDVKHLNAVITRYADANALFVKVGDMWCNNCK